MERARVLKEEGNELVKKGNHKKAIEKYSESLSFSNLESATYSNRYLRSAAGLGDFRTADIMPHASLGLWWALHPKQLVRMSQLKTCIHATSRCEACVASVTCSLKGVETEGCQRGA